MIRAITTAGLGIIETAVVKATFEDNEQPKSKHVITLKDWVETDLKGSGNTYQGEKVNIVSLLERRVEIQSWRVVLKTLSVIHLLLREADVAFTEEFANYGTRSILTARCCQFVDRESINGLPFSSFIREYARYLVEKVHNFNELSFNIERKLEPSNKNFFTEYSANQLGKCLPKFMKQMNTLVECHAIMAGNEFAVNEIVRFAVLLLIKDSLRLYAAIQLCLWQMICSFQKLTLEQAKWTSRTCDRYFTLNKSYQEWFQRCVRLDIIEESFAPKFDVLSESLVEKLNDYISENDGSGGKNSKAKKKRKKVRKKNHKNQKNKKKKRKKMKKMMTTMTMAKRQIMIGKHLIWTMLTLRPQKKQQRLRKQMTEM